MKLKKKCQSYYKKQILSRFALWGISFYQKAISPWLPKSCRFYPSCSSYSKSAFENFGFFKACFLTLKRLSRCHPFYKGNLNDPIKKLEREAN